MNMIGHRQDLPTLHNSEITGDDKPYTLPPKPNTYADGTPYPPGPKKPEFNTEGTITKRTNVTGEVSENIHADDAHYHRRD